MSRTVLINCSPKKRLSVSGFIAKCAGGMIRGEKVYADVRTPADHEAALQALDEHPDIPRAEENLSHIKQGETEINDLHVVATRDNLIQYLIIPGCHDCHARKAGICRFSDGQAVDIITAAAEKAGQPGKYTGRVVYQYGKYPLLHNYSLI